MYWSLKTRKVSESEKSGDVSKRTSPDDRRSTEKPNGVVSWRVKMRSDAGSKMKEAFVEPTWFSGRERIREFDRRGIIWSGISHRSRVESVIRILNRSLVSKLQ